MQSELFMDTKGARRDEPDSEWGQIIEINLLFIDSHHMFHIGKLLHIKHVFFYQFIDMHYIFFSLKCKRSNNTAVF